MDFYKVVIFALHFKKIHQIKTERHPSPSSQVQSESPVSCEVRGGVVSADVPQQQLPVRTGVVTLLAWKRLASVMTASVEVQTLLLDTAVVTELTAVRFLSAVSSLVSEQRAAVDRSIRTLRASVGLLPCVCPQVLQQ